MIIARICFPQSGIPADILDREKQTQEVRANDTCWTLQILIVRLVQPPVMSVAIHSCQPAVSLTYDVAYRSSIRLLSDLPWS